MNYTTQALEPVLMLVPYFAPQTHAAMFRAHKLAKYLPEYGYKPVVVTTDINYLYNEDKSLLEELPAVTEIHRARYIEPTLRGVRMAFGGKDRTFWALKGNGDYSGTNATQALKPTSPSQDYRLSAADLVRWLGEWPDRHWTWSLSAFAVCRRLIRDMKIRLIYTSAVPVSPLLTAQALQREFGLKWVADYRDPVGYGQKHSAKGILASAFERHILQRSMQQADIVTGLADAYGQIFFDLFDLPEQRYRFIPTGLDEAYLDGGLMEQPSGDVLLYVGEVMPNQSDHAFRVIAKAKHLAVDSLRELRLVFVGRKEINEPRIRSITNQIDDWNIPFEFVDHVPQAKVYALARHARACLLIPGQHRYWWTNFAKLVDYLALRVPVIADVPALSEAQQELSKSGQAFFLVGNDISSDALRFLEWWQGKSLQAYTDYGQRYTALRQTASFAQVFNELLK